MTSGIARIAFVACIAVTHAVAQQPSLDLCSATPRATYDVVSIKPSQSPSGRSSMHTTSDGIVATSALRNIILHAFHLQGFQLTGGADWVSGSSWEIRGRLDTPDPEYFTLDQPARDALVIKNQQRLQSILVDRFGFQCHMITKELPVYELVAAKSGSKLKQTTAETKKQGSASINGNNRKVHAVFTGITTERLAELLSSEVDRLVTDKTGLTGNYDMTIDWVNDAAAGADAAADTSAGADIFTALQEQLGLKLQPAKGSVPVMVIDHVDQPAEN